MQSGNLNKQSGNDWSRVEAAEGFEGAFPATAGDTACPPGAFCCSFAGNGFGVLPFGGGVNDKFLASLRS